MRENTVLNDWTSTKSYASRENLVNAIDRAALGHVRGILIVLTPAGRWTAIFGKSFLDAANIPMMFAINAGFKVIG